MSHFDSGFDAIVDGTYSQEYGGTNIENYSLFKIENGVIVNCISWYKESQLTLLEIQDRDKAEEMIENYRFKQLCVNCVSLSVDITKAEV